MRPLHAILTTLAIVLSLSLAWGGPHRALAHADPVMTYPANGAELDESPPEIRISFSEPIEAAASRLIIQNAQGQPVHGAHQSSPDTRTLVLTLPPIDRGVYTAAWEVMSTDTHATTGQITFSVMAALPQTVPVQPAPVSGGTTPPGGDGAGSGQAVDRAPDREFPWLWVVVGTGLLVLFGVGMRRR